MARQSKDYKNKKFVIGELSNALKKTMNSFSIDPDAVSIGYYFVIDGIDDNKKLTFGEAEMITAFEEDVTLQLFFTSTDFKDYIIMLSVRSSSYYEKEVLRISIEFPTVEELKRAFSIIEMELNLESISEQDNKDKEIKSLITDTKDEDQNETLKKSFEPLQNSFDKEKSHINHIKKDYEKIYGPLRIFKEDLIFIMGLFQESYKHCEIKIDEYEGIKNKSDIDAIKAGINKDSTKNLRINGSNIQYGSNLTLRLSEHSARITVDDDKDVKSIGVLNQIDPILSKRENKILKFIDSKWGLPIIFIITIAIMVIAIMVINSLYADNLALKKTFFIILIPLGFVPLVCSLMSMIWINNKYTLIYLFNSNEKQHLLTRHRDEIIVGIIITVVGGLIFLLIASAFGLKY